MEKIRIGNDIELRWKVYTAQDENTLIPYDLTGRELKASLRCDFGETPVDFRTEENELIAIFRGKDQKALGQYYIILRENDGKDAMKTVDTQEAFELVPRTMDESHSEDGVVRCFHLTFESVVGSWSGTIDPILNHDAEVAEAQRRANEESRVAAEQARQKASAEAVASANAAAENANIKAEEANNAAISANSAAKTANAAASKADNAAVTAQEKAEAASGAAETATSAAESANRAAEDAQQKASLAHEATLSANSAAEAADTAAGRANEAADKFASSVVQQQGTATDKVMSQKAVTDALTASDQKLSELDEEIGNSEDVSFVVGNAESINAVWDGSKFAASSGYKTFIIPLKDGAEYAFFIQGVSNAKLSSEKPVVGGTGGTTINKPSGDYTGTSEYPYLSLAYTTENLHYANISIIKEKAHGLKKDVQSINTDLSKVTTRLDTMEMKVGDDVIKIVVSEMESIDAVWDGSKFAVTSGYKTFIIPIKKGIVYSLDVIGVSYAKLSSEKPIVGGTGGTTINKPSGDYTGTSEYPYLTLAYTTTNVHYASTSYIDASPTGIYELLSRKEDKSLIGKNIVFFGDSIVEGIGVTRGQKSLSVLLSEISGANVVRGGIGGSQLGARGDVVASPTTTREAYANLDIPNLVYAWANSQWSSVDSAVTYLKNNASDDNTSIINALKGISIQDTDIVLVAGGTNDLNASTFGTHESVNQKSLRGGIKYIVSSLLAIKPTLSVYFFNPLPRITATLQEPTIPVYSDDYRAGEECSFLNLVKSILEECSAIHVPCGDTYHRIGINQYNIQSYGGGADGTDYTHITKVYPRYARFIYQFMLSTSAWG